MVLAPLDCAAFAGATEATSVLVGALDLPPPDMTQSAPTTNAIVSPPAVRFIVPLSFAAV